jgi:hypothetical protein
MPLDLELLQKRTSGNSFFDAPALVGEKSGLFSVEQRYVPLDVEYGVATYARNRPTWFNIAFTRHITERYGDVYPEIRRDRTQFLSIGALRRTKLTADARRQDTWRPAREWVSERNRLDALLDKLRQLAADCGYQVWMRGQPVDYQTSNLSGEARAGLCPWRAVRDSSVVPSLYRKLSKVLEERPLFKRFCHELAVASQFLELTLFQSPSTERRLYEQRKEWTAAAWYRALPVPMPTAVRTSDGQRSTSTLFFGEPDPAVLAQLPPDATIHDYNPVLRSLQSAFFMQHYGLPSNLLDLTNDLDVALFFAQHEVAGADMVPVDFHARRPVIHVFLVDPNQDIFIDSAALASSYDMLRPLRQHCGVLAGASMINRNEYARVLALTIHLEERLPTPENFARHLFPPSGEDPFLKRLDEFAEGEGLSNMYPWALREGRERSRSGSAIVTGS